MLGSILVLTGIFVFIQFATINNVEGNIGNVVTMMAVILLLSFGGLLARRDC